MRRSYQNQQRRPRWRDNSRESRDDRDDRDDRDGRDGRDDGEQWGARRESGAQVAWRDVNKKLDDIQTDVQELALRMQTIMTRAEIEAALDRRVSLERYTSDLNDISSRLTRQETGWSRILPWLSLVVSVVGVGIPVLLAVLYGIIYLAQHP